MPVDDRGAVTRRARKHKPLLLGSTFLRLLVGNRKFSAHEDLLCSRSTFFKNRFQAVRKDISGDCAVCLSELEMTDTEYCKTCGQNFHVSCMENWVITSTCPTCRTLRRKVDDLRSFTLENLDPEGFEVYVQWLYSNQIPDYASGTTDEGIIRLLKAHIVGNTLTDTHFLQAVRTKIADIAIAARKQARMTYNAVEFIYQNTHESCAVRRFMVDLYIVTGSQESLKDHGNVSRLLLIDIAQSYMQRSEPRRGDADVWSMLVDEGHIEPEVDEDESRSTQQPEGSR